MGEENDVEIEPEVCVRIEDDGEIENKAVVS